MGKVYRAALAAEKKAAKAAEQPSPRHVVRFEIVANGIFYLYCTCGDSEKWYQQYGEMELFSELIEWAETHSNCEACGLPDDECPCSCECCCECVGPKSSGSLT